MKSPAIETARAGGAADMLVVLARTDGSGSHPFVVSRELLDGREAARNLADAVHYLSVLHGRHPGVIDYAAARTSHEAARDWLAEAADGFARERTALTALVVAAGPLPSTPGQAESEAAVLQQRHALEMLARSDRNGTALGAAFALVLDWRAIRSVLDSAAARLGIHLPAMILPSETDTRVVAIAVAEAGSVERALGFGAQQILAQHRGLWDLLEARRIARIDV